MSGMFFETQCSLTTTRTDRAVTGAGKGTSNSAKAEGPRCRVEA